MHISLLLVTVIAVGVVLQGPPPPRRLPPPGVTATSSSTQVISPVAVMTWVTRNGNDGVHALDLIVLWRGTPGWFIRGGSQSSSSGGSSGGSTGGSSGSLGGGAGGGSAGSFHATARYGEVELRVGLQTAKRTVELQGQKIELGEANVVLVDEVDSIAGAKVVRTLRIDPAVPLADGGRPGVEEVLRRSPVILAFLQCQTPMPDGKGQAMIDLICARVIGRHP